MSKSYHLLAKEQLVLQEKFMVVSATIIPSCNTSETIEIQLALKRCELRLAEVDWHNFGHELLWLVYHKASAVRLPVHIMNDNKFELPNQDQEDHDRPKCSMQLVYNVLINLP